MLSDDVQQIVNDLDASKTTAYCSIPTKIRNKILMYIYHISSHKGPAYLIAKVFGGALIGGRRLLQGDAY